jgi:hypothetical protein
MTGCLKRCQVSPIFADLVDFIPVMRYPTCPVHRLPVGQGSGTITPTCMASRNQMSRLTHLIQVWGNSLDTGEVMSRTSDAVKGGVNVKVFDVCVMYV